MEVVDPVRQVIPGLDHPDLRGIRQAKELDRIGEKPAFDVPVSETADHDHAVDPLELY
jgi:hypothetical protein